MEGTSNNAIPFERHPLYQEAMQQIVAGDEVGSIATLKRLAERYPNEQALQDLLVRVQLRSSFADGDHIPVDHSQGAPVLRTLVLVMLAITTCLVVATGLVAVYNNWWLPTAEAKQQEESIKSLWDDVNWRLDTGDLSGARETLVKLAAVSPDDASVQEALRVINQRQLWADMFADAVSLRESGNWQTAMDLLYQLPPESHDYDRAQVLLHELKEFESVETAWQEAQNLLAAEDWRGAITTLTWIRSQNPGFRRAHVEDLLFQTHTRVAHQLLDGANGDAESVRQAGSHLKEALTFRPADQALSDQRRLALGYVAGYEAYDRGDWSVAVVRWEPLYAMQPDYQNGVLKRKLYESYPRAARQLIAEASGSIRLLTQAIDYLDAALAADPENADLLQERTLAVEYLAGLEASVQEDWDLAIAHWGPIYVVRPDYQNGILAENLRAACAKSLAPDEQFCKP